MKIKCNILFCFYSSSVIFGQNVENTKLNEELSAEQVFDKSRER